MHREWRQALEGYAANNVLLSRWLVIVLSGLGGAGFAFWLYGWGVINPTSVRWLLLEGDPFQHFIGWEAFRQDEWRWPLGAIPQFGTQVDASIVFMDAIPLLALPLKLISDWLPTPFQYQGIAMLLNVMLNASVGCWVALRLGAKPLIALLFAALLILSPIVIMRGLGAHGHESLTAHWLILGAIYMAAMPRPGSVRAFAWLGLLLLAVAIHFYLFFMVGVIWASAWAAHAFGLLLKQRYWACARLLLIALGYVVVVLGCMWVLGYFQYELEVPKQTGFGFFSAEWMTFLNPRSHAWFLNHTELFSASRVLPGWLPPIEGQYEGQAYAGVGMIALVLVALGVAIRRCASEVFYAMTLERCFLVVALLVLFLFALGDRWVIGRLVWEIPYPDFTESLTQYLRSSGRLVWPLFYAVLLTALIILVHYLRVRTAIAVISTALVIQWADMVPMNHFIRDSLAGRVADTQSGYPYPVIENSRLETLLAESEAIYYLPGGDLEQLKPFLWLAVQHEVTINVAYFARSQSEALEAASRHLVEEALEGNLVPKTTYVITDSNLSEAVCSKARVACFAEGDITFAHINKN